MKRGAIFLSVSSLENTESFTVTMVPPCFSASLSATAFQSSIAAVFSEITMAYPFLPESLLTVFTTVVRTQKAAGETAAWGESALYASF